MAKYLIDDAQLKKAVRKVLREVLIEDKDLLRAFISEVAEDFALAELMKEGRKSKMVPRQSVMKILKGKK